jgi:glyoxylase-like metal-dependent hydrolase (beta-lactamase superfamily II)
MMIEQIKGGCKLLAMFVLANTALGADWCKNIPRPQFAQLEKVSINSDWFQVYRVKPNVFAISEQRQYEEVISYFIVGSRRALLWDTGMGIAKIRPLVESLSKIPIIVLNSHTHPDHMGGNYEFNEIWGVKDDFTKQNADGNSDPALRKLVDPDHICGSLPVGFDQAKYSIHSFRISHFVKDEEIIDLGDRKLQVFRIPGHTPDSLALIDRKNRFLLTGDSFYPGPIYLFSPETNFAEYVKSINRLAAHVNEIDDLLTSHNEPLRPASTLLALKQALADLQAGKITPDESEGLKEYKFDSFSILMK